MGPGYYPMLQGSRWKHRGSAVTCPRSHRWERRSQDSNQPLDTIFNCFSSEGWVEVDSPFSASLCVCVLSNHLGIPFLTFLQLPGPQKSGQLSRESSHAQESVCAFLIREARGSVEVGRIARGAATRSGQYSREEAGRCPWCGLGT